ncbi:collagen alpha-1(II) chain [Aplysia californica]|uniref:Collagen alpha-1(II) chain n=1 Tax=Aplysia californica TaxID=6500 RepID=A0ABM1A8G3_APLCA|nr:collagen alpha-1(II) chain [Aplysia californica]
MEAGPVIKMGLGALASRKVKGEVTTWKDISPPSEGWATGNSPPQRTPGHSPPQRNPGQQPPSPHSPHSPHSPAWAEADTRMGKSPTKGGNRSPVKNKTGAATTGKPSPKKQNSASKSPRLVRKSSGRNSSNSNKSSPPAHDNGSASSASSSEAGSPKRSKSGKVKAAVSGGQLDRQRLVGRYRIPGGQAGCVEGGLTAWKDAGPREPSAVPGEAGAPSERGGLAGVPQERGGSAARPESGYFSTDVHSESREGMEESTSEGELVGTIKLRPRPDKRPALIQAGAATLADHSQNGPAGPQTEGRDLLDSNPVPSSGESEMCSVGDTGGEEGEVGGREAPAEPVPIAVVRVSGVAAMSCSPDCRSLTESDGPDQRSSQDDYFFDEDFSVQFGGGGLHGSVGLTLQGSCAFSLTDSLAAGPSADPQDSLCGPQAILPHSLTGSYTAFGALRDSFLQNEDLYSGPCESEVSATGSRTSMEVSSSEREMMCSSDMLDYPGSAPLFTPPCVANSQEGHVSTDSLSRQLEGEVTASTSLSRSSSSTAEITLRCGRPHKDAYFLSFDGGSQGKLSSTESDSSYVSQSSSQDDKPRTGSRSMSSGGDDAEDEQSSSFQFANARPASGDSGGESCYNGYIALVPSLLL